MSTSSSVSVYQSSSNILLIVGGEKFEVCSWEILKRLPQSRLGKLSASSSDGSTLSEICDDYNVDKNEYFFNRNSKTFSSVLSFYYSGKLHMPDGICVVAFTDDLKYWGIEEAYLDSCCRHKYFQIMEQVREEAKEVEETVCVEHDEHFGNNSCAKLRGCIWNAFEKPTSSCLSKIIAVVSITSIIVSTIVLALNTMPDFQMFECVYENTTLCADLGSEKGRDNWKSVENYYFALAEELCITWFTFEYLVRLLVSPEKWKFLTDMFNIFDLLAILPYYITIILISSNPDDSFVHIRATAQVCRLMRTIRVFKLARHSTGLQSFLFTLGKSYRELGILFLLLVMGVLLFSSLAYYAEKNHNEYFDSIPAAFWWAAVTMDAVGLGDMQPITTVGKLVTFACGVCGMLFIGLPIPIIVDSFTMYYNQQMRRLKIVKKYQALRQQEGNGRSLEQIMSTRRFTYVGHVADQLSKGLDSRSFRPVLNVGGVKFQVTWNILHIVPNSRLSRLQECTTHESLLQICDDYLIDDNEYFFHRDPKPFCSILNFYFSGKLHLLDDPCPIAFEEEMHYWMIDPLYVQSCCQYRLNKMKEQICMEIKEIQSLLREVEEDDFGSSHFANCRKMVWNVLENHSSSGFSKTFGFASIFVTLLSAVILTMKTMDDISELENASSANNLNQASNSTFQALMDESSALLSTEIFCISWFGCAYILRLIVSPNKIKFLKGKLNILDPLIVILYILSWCLLSYGISVKLGTILKYLCETLRILRLLRIFKLGKHSTALEALGFTLKNSIKHLGILLLFLAIGVLVFSSLVYISEREENPQFKSIPTTFWWALITMHTVAVGDVQTITMSGKVVSFICGLFGLLFLVLPIPIIASNFEEFYRKKMRRERAERKCNNASLKLKNTANENETGNALDEI